MIGIGAPAIALQGKCADQNPAPGTLCQTQYETLPLGAALVGAGSALAITGIVLLAYSPKAARKGQPESQRR